MRSRRERICRHRTASDSSSRHPRSRKFSSGRNGPGQSDIDGLRDDLSWAEGYPIDAQTAVVAAAIADDIGPHGPLLTGMDALIAAVGPELDAPIVSSDGDLTHEATQAVLEVERY